MRRPPLRPTVSALAIVAVAVALTPPGDAAASPVATPTTQTLEAWRPYLLAQAALDTSAQQIVAAAGSGSGLADVAISVPDHTLTVSWKGTVSAPAATAIAAARRRGVRVSMHSARYSREELEARARAITAMAEQLRVEGTTVVRIAPRADASGLEVGVMPSAAAAGATPAAASSLAALGPDITIVAENGNRPTDRINDSSPHWAGARIARDDDAGSTCTSGWPVRRRSDGRTFMLTANHCHGLTWWSDGHWRDTSSNNTWKFGDVWSDQHNTALDVETIRSVVGSDTYDGGVKPGTEFVKAVSDAQTGYIRGLSVCQSGSWSGVHCGLTVTGWEVVLLNGENYYVDSIRVSAPTNGITWAAGDSGGPIFTLNGADPSKVVARGMISSSHGNGFGCSNNWGESLHCFNDSDFVDIMKILSNFGDDIVTG